MDTPKQIALVAHDDKKHDLPSADFMISSPLLSNTYRRVLPDYHGYTHRMDDDLMDQEQEALVA